MHADVDIAVLESDRQPIRPDFQFDQILYWHVLQGTDPLSRDKEAGISIDDELDGIPIGYITTACARISVSGCARRAMSAAAYSASVIWC